MSATARDYPTDGYQRLDLAGLKARIDEDWVTRDLSLVLLDIHGNVADLHASDVDAAIAALDQLAEVAGRLAGLLRVRRGDRREVLTDAPEPRDLAVVEALTAGAPPMNAGASTRRTLAEERAEEDAWLAQQW